MSAEKPRWRNAASIRNGVMQTVGFFIREAKAESARARVFRNRDREGSASAFTFFIDRESMGSKTRNFFRQEEAA